MDSVVVESTVLVTIGVSILLGIVTIRVETETQEQPLSPSQLVSVIVLFQ